MPKYVANVPEIAVLGDLCPGFEEMDRQQSMYGQKKTLSHWWNLWMTGHLLWSFLIENVALKFLFKDMGSGKEV